jgi:hypothetical protein
VDSVDIVDSLSRNQNLNVNFRPDTEFGIKGIGGVGRWLYNKFETSSPANIKFALRALR